MELLKYLLPKETYAHQLQESNGNSFIYTIKTIFSAIFLLLGTFYFVQSITGEFDSKDKLRDRKTIGSAFSTFNSPPIDTDGDGLADISDLDDDNDGILDTDEGCMDCNSAPFLNGNFEDGPYPAGYTVTNENNVSGWETTSNDNGIEIWRSGFRGVNSQSGSYHAEINANRTASLYQKVCTNPGAQFRWSVWHRGRAGVDVATVRIGENLGNSPIQITMVSDNTSWVEYSGVYSVPMNQSETYFIFEAVRTANGNTSTGNFIDNIVINEINQGFCPDFDGDGIPNYLDLDSDNDGCPDYIEGGASFGIGDGRSASGLATGGSGSGVTTNLGNTIDANGVPIVVNGGQGVGNSQNASTQDTECLDECDPLTSGNPDTDGDGITDVCDLDDDNDGILDTDECNQFVSETAFNVAGGNSVNFSLPGTMGLVLDVTNLDNSFDITVNGTNITSQELQFYAPATPSIRFVDGSLWGQGGVPEVWMFGNVSPNTPILRFIINENGNVTMYGSKTANGSLFELELINGNMFNNFTWNENLNNNFVVSQSVIGPTFIQGRIYGANIGCDYDNDGIPNELDLDSDNDGCPDAIEGTGGSQEYETAELEPNGSIDITLFPIDGNGVPHNGSSQAVGTSQNPTEVIVQCPIQRTVNDNGVSLAINASALTTNTFMGTAPNTLPDYTNGTDASVGLRYQWYADGSPVTDGGIHLGSATQNLTINTDLTNHDVVYCVTVTHIDYPCFEETLCASPTFVNQQVCAGTVVELPTTGTMNGTWNPTTPDTSLIGDTMYTFTPDNACGLNGNETGHSFILTVEEPNLADTLEDVTVCDQYELPSLQNGRFFTGPNGSGNELEPGTVLTTTQTVYIYIPQTDYCPADQSSFVVTIDNIVPNLSVLGCDDSGTDFDVTDDSFIFMLNPTGANGTQNYTVSIDNGAELAPTTGIFGQETTFSISGITAIPQDFVVTVTVDNGCSQQITLEGVQTCSDACLLTNLNENVKGCNDAGSIHDTTDDYFEISFDPQGFNLSGQYVVSVDNGATVTPSIANYGQETDFIINGAHDSSTRYAVTISDNENGACALTMNFIGNTCSPVCFLEEANADSLCNDAGTDFDVSDDFIDLFLNPTGLNLSNGYTVSIDNGAEINPKDAIYGSTTSFRISGATDTEVTYLVTITDNESDTCFLQVPLQGIACSPVTLITEANSNTSCNDAGTNYDPEDDFLDLELNPTGFNINPGASYSVSINNGGTIQPTRGTYGNPFNFAIYGAINGQTYTVSITDDSNPNSRISVEIIGAHCSDTCLLVEANPVIIGCNDNRTIYVDETSDDYIEFSLFPSGFNLGGNYLVTYNGNGHVEPSLAKYGEVTDFKLYPGSADGVTEHILILSDAESESCELKIVLDNMQSCSNLQLPFVTNDLIDPTSQSLELFHISNIEDFPNNKVKIYNRWGRLVFEIHGYNNESRSFNGLSNQKLVIRKDEKLPSGVYFYVIDFADVYGKKGHFNGYLYLKSKG
ncbi:hypothetical protein BFP77_14070 [Maribacter sp. 4U21]|uniref:gliding motility-associated C-terminal domain-containing protein n=1 Tax=Maribacter sp. 4U21 TaxID=1889779 RepID=UPI000C15A728|nr:gliding motility-associated C-terminal domain-containing protein [Maribacter sp. 4U21]PIB26902.1 hypothetical protein BFP77_14070 [Maribacter sp. 4U21]